MAVAAKHNLQAYNSSLYCALEVNQLATPTPEKKKRRGAIYAVIA